MSACPVCGTPSCTSGDCAKFIDDGHDPLDAHAVAWWQWRDQLIRTALVTGAENSGIASGAIGDAAMLADDLVRDVIDAVGPPPKQPRGEEDC